MTARRRDAATAALGYGLVAAGGTVRGSAIDDAHALLRAPRRFIPPSQAVYRARKLVGGRAIAHRWGAGTALVTLGAPAAAKGTADLVRRRRTTTAKRDRSFVAEGVQGTAAAWQDKAHGFQSGAPLRVRAVPVAVGAGAGAAGSVAAHRALDLIGRRRRVSPRLRSAVTAAAAVPAVVASLPVSRRWTRRHGYDPQPTGGLVAVGKSQWLGHDYYPASEFYGSDPLFGEAGRQRRMKAQREHLDFERTNRARDAASRQRWGQPPTSLENRHSQARHQLIPDQEQHGPVLRSAANKRVFYDPSVGRHNRSRLEPQVGRHPLRRPVTVAISDDANDARGQVFMGSRRANPRLELSRQLWDRTHGPNSRKLRAHVLHHELAHANRRGSVHRPGISAVGYFMTHEPGLREEGRADAIAAQHSTFRRNAYSGLTHWGKNPFLETKTHVAGQLRRVRKALRVTGVVGEPERVVRGRMSLAGGIAGAGAFHHPWYGGSPRNPTKAELDDIVSQAREFRTSAGRKRTVTRTEARRAADHDIWQQQRAQHESVLATRPRRLMRRPYISKADTVYRGPDYLGRHVTGRQQRLRIYAAGGTPVVGPVAQVRQAGRYAPPGHRASAMVRQAAGGPGAGTAGGVAGAYGGAALAHRSVLVARHAHRLTQGVADLKARALGRASKPVGNEMPKLLRPFAAHPAVRPLVGSKTRLIGAGVGYVAGKTVAGQIGGNVAISRNITAQHRYDSHRMRAAPMTKAAGQPLSARQRDVLARRKRRSAVMSVVAGSAGLTALGLHGARRLPQYAHRSEQLGRYRETALAVGAGIGGLNAITNAEIQRREARNIAKAMALPHRGDASRYAAARLATTASRAADALERRPGRLRKTGASGLRLVALDPTPLAQSTRLLLRVHKRSSDPLHTQMTDNEAHRIVHGPGGYGLTGTLPHHLDRSERMRAYEARYLAAGGRHAEHWQRRAQHAETSRNVGLAGATGAGAVWLAASSPRVRRAARPLSRLTRHRVDAATVRRGAERSGIAAGVLGGAAELFEEHARAKRGSYASAPGGVAASALRRMRGYSTGEDS